MPGIYFILNRKQVVLPKKKNWKLKQKVEKWMAYKEAEKEVCLQKDGLSFAYK